MILTLVVKIGKIKKLYNVFHNPTSSYLSHFLVILIQTLCASRN